MTETSEQHHTSRTNDLGDRDQELPRRTDVLRRLQLGNLPMVVGEGALLVAAGRLWNGVPGEYGLHGAVVQRVDENGGVGYYSASLTRRQGEGIGDDFSIEYGQPVIPEVDDDGVTTFRSPDHPTE